MNGNRYKIRHMKNGYKWVHINNIEKDGLFFNAAICFYNNRLFNINVGFDDKNGNIFTWENCNEEEELKQLAMYENW